MLFTKHSSTDPQFGLSNEIPCFLASQRAEKLQVVKFCDLKKIRLYLVSKNPHFHRSYLLVYDISRTALYGYSSKWNISEKWEPMSLPGKIGNLILKFLDFYQFCQTLTDLPRYWHYKMIFLHTRPFIEKSH